MTKDNTCANCVYMRMSLTYDSIMECHRSAPRPPWDGWVDVDPSDWCGDYRRRMEPVSAVPTRIPSDPVVTHIHPTVTSTIQPGLAVRVQTSLSHNAGLSPASFS